MCCIFFTTECDGYALVLASNRDEYLSRSTAPAAWHAFPKPSTFRPDKGTISLAVPEDPSQLLSAPSASHPVLSGIDAHPSGGGTWLGITRNGKWGALTNFTEVAPPPLPQGREGLTQYRSRGQLVKDWLSAGPELTVDEYAARIAARRDEFPGFNILLGLLPAADDKTSQGRLLYVTNRNKTGSSPEEVLKPGPDGMPGGMEILIGQSGTSDQRKSGCLACELPPTSSDTVGLSNSVLREPWKKVQSGSQQFNRAVLSHTSDEGVLIESLFGVMGTSSTDEISSRQDMQSSVLIPPLQLPMKPLHIQQVTSAAVPSESRINTDPVPVVDSAAHAQKSISSADERQQAGQQAQSPSDQTPPLSWYATRTSTVILVRPSGRVTFVERDVHVLSKGDGRPSKVVSHTDLRQRRYNFDLVTERQ